MKKNNSSIQEQIDKIHYENYINKKLHRIESNTTQVQGNTIKTCDLGLVTLALLNKHELIEIQNERGVWLIANNKNMEDLYTKYKAKEALVDPLVYSKTLINLINGGI